MERILAWALAEVGLRRHRSRQRRREPRPCACRGQELSRQFRDTGGGSAAKGDRLTRIEDRLRETRQWLRVEESSQIAERWIGDLYQSANRFATLRFFRSHLNPPADAWLLNLYFLNDRTHKSSKRATTREKWEAELPRAEADLGLKGKPIAHSGRAFVDAGTYEELVAATGG
jgi:hypothetical protein